MKFQIFVLFILFTSCQNKCSFEQAVLFEESGELEAAIKCYKNILFLDGEMKACKRLIEIYTSLNKVDSIIKYREIVFWDNSNDLENTFELGNLNYKKGNLDQSLNYFMMVQRSDSLYPKLNYNLAVIYLSMGAHIAALKNIQDEITKHGSSSENYALLGQVHLQHDNYKESLSAYTAAIHLDRENESYYFLRGITFYYADSLKKAVDDLDVCLSINKNHANALKLKIQIGIESNAFNVCPEIHRLEKIETLSEEMEKIKNDCNI